MKCDLCGSPRVKIKYKGMLLCESCCLEKLEDDKIIKTTTETFYWSSDGEYLGSDGEGLEMEISEILDWGNIEYEKIEEDDFDD